jgi:DNA-binding MarR family transcriptional regulator
MKKDMETKSEQKAVVRTGRGAAAARAAAKVAAAPDQRALAQSVLEEFRLIFKAVRRHFQWVEAQTGVSAAQMCLLGQVDERPGIRVTELARELAIHQSTASNLVERLESARLLKRERSDADQRVVRLHLTAAGRRLVAAAPKPLEGLLPYALRQMPARDLQPLREHLEGLTDVMQSLEKAQKKRAAKSE